MTDEKYTFVQDVRDRKRVARGAHNKRTHCGKGGAVKFPSDYKTRKELKAMNGEMKSYNINEPMKWREFKALPDDIKIVYIKALREKFGVSDTRIAVEMMDITRVYVAREISRLGIGLGNGKRQTFDKVGWMNWLYGNPTPECEETHENATESVCEVAHEIAQASAEDAAESVCEAKNKAIPLSGSLTFEGNIEDALNALGVLLGGANVHLNVAWEVDGDAE